MNNFAVTVKDVCFAYEKEMVLKHLSMNIGKNRVCFIMGNNGSGKTTLLKNIMGFLKPQKGQILVDDKNISMLDYRTVSRMVSYVPQAIYLNSDFSVVDYLSFGRSPHIGTSAKLNDNDYKIIDHYAEMFEIDEFIDSSFNKLSGGQKQIVAIARSLIQETPLIIMDEPMSALDMNKQVQLLSLLLKLSHEGKTVLLTTHNPNHALAIESDTCFMKNGSIVSFGNTEEIINNKTLQTVYGNNIQLKNANGGRFVVFNVNE